MRGMSSIEFRRKMATLIMNHNDLVRKFMLEEQSFHELDIEVTRFRWHLLTKERFDVLGALEYSLPTEYYGAEQ